MRRKPLTKSAAPALAQPAGATGKPAHSRPSPVSGTLSTPKPLACAGHAPATPAETAGKAPVPAPVPPVPPARSDAEREALRAAVREYLAAGSDELHAAELLALEHGLTAEAARREARAAVRDLERRLLRRISPGEHIAVSLQQRNRVVRSALADGDCRTALAAIDGRDKLLGLYGREYGDEDPKARNLFDLISRAQGGVHTDPSAED